MDKATCLAMLRETFSASKFGRYCGIVLDEVGCGWARNHFEVREELLDDEGGLSEGVVETLTDNAAGASCRSKGAVCVTQTMTCHFIRRAVEGKTVRADGRVVGRDGKSYMVEVTVSDDAPTPLCRVYLVMYAIRMNDDIPEEW